MPAFPHGPTGCTASGGDAPEAPFRTRDVVELVGVSRRQLQYWIQTGLIRPAARTPGGHHRFAFRDLVSLRAARRLLDAGVPLQRLRRSIHALRRALPAVERPLSELVLVATGDVVLVLHRGAAFEAVTGQEWVFEVARFAREVEAWRRETRSTPRGASRAPGRG